ncbi:MAG: hypothetical protein HY985_14170 [Magnetospirillum sp.]|nr:hypothetical protein [Magnetospirillum sp.]
MGRSTSRAVSVAVLLVSTAILSHATQAQDHVVQDHLRHLLVRADTTPGNRGVIDIARTEALIAQQAVRAARGQSDLAALKAQVVAAVNALDPTLVPTGPGLGYGLRPALSATVAEITALISAASGNNEVLLRATPATVSAQTALTRTDESIAIARQVLSAGSVAEAEAPLARLDAALNRIIAGEDLDRDGEIAWSRGEGGLRQTWSFVRQMAIGEGLAEVK